MKKIYLITATLALAGCGTVFNGTTQDINIDSNVKNVDVYIDGAFVCKTPCIFPAERSSGSLAIIGKKEGYDDIGISLKSKINTVAIGNLTFVYSWTTDLADGAVWAYRQDGVYLNMKKKNMTHAEKQEFHRNSQIRRYVLMNYPDLRNEAASKTFDGEYIKGLEKLTAISAQNISEKIILSQNEVHCAEILSK
ncbi:MAG: PEGA domain-containing protein [Alphaproteobacteria bacterium]|nr:PEGA domain-containing protein [Alphaproteobacteria bacterium]